MITEIESRSVFGYLSFNCGRISGGTGANVIPDSCEFPSVSDTRQMCSMKKPSLS